MASTTTLPESASPSANSTPKITVHWLDKSRSQRILWLLEELHLPYTVRFYKRGSNFRAPASLKDVHPLGKSPVVEIEENGESFILAESGFIFEYLCGRFGGMERGLWPTRFMPTVKATEGGGVRDEETSGRESEAWRRHAFYMHFVEGSLTPPLVTGLLVEGIRNAPVPFFIRPITRSIACNIDTSYLSNEYNNLFGFVESQLPENVTTVASSGSPHPFPSITGLSLVTAADILLSFPLLAAMAKEIISKEKYPRIGRFCEACEERDEYKKAVQRAESENDGEIYTVI